MRLAVAGKGGVGKTTIAGTMARFAAGKGRAVLALDADSNPNLAVPLGLAPDRAAGITPVPQDLGRWMTDSQGRAYLELSMPVQAVMDRYGVAGPGDVRLLVMGTVDHAGVGCRCNAHAAARGITGHLVAEADVAVLDMEAGLEHLGRGTVEHVDTLLIVTEPYYRSLEAAGRIRDLARELGVPRIAVVGNRVRNPEETEAISRYCRSRDLNLAGTVPYDEAITESEKRGMAPIDYAPGSPAVVAIQRLADVLLPAI